MEAPEFLSETMAFLCIVHCLAYYSIMKAWLPLHFLCSQDCLCVIMESQEVHLVEIVEVCCKGTRHLILRLIIPFTANRVNCTLCHSWQERRILFRQGEADGAATGR